MNFVFTFLFYLIIESREWTLTWGVWGIWATSEHQDHCLKSLRACRVFSVWGRSGSWVACLWDHTSPRTSSPPCPGGWTRWAGWCPCQGFDIPSYQDWCGPEKYLQLIAKVVWVEKLFSNSPNTARHNWSSRRECRRRQWRGKRGERAGMIQKLQSQQWNLPRWTLAPVDHWELTPRSCKEDCCWRRWLELRWTTASSDHASSSWVIRTHSLLDSVARTMLAWCPWVWRGQSQNQTWFLLVSRAQVMMWEVDQSFSGTPSKQRNQKTFEMHFSCWQTELHHLPLLIFFVCYKPLQGSPRKLTNLHWSLQRRSPMAARLVLGLLFPIYWLRNRIALEDHSWVKYFLGQGKYFSWLSDISSQDPDTDHRDCCQEV